MGRTILRWTSLAPFGLRLELIVYQYGVVGERSDQEAYNNRESRHACIVSREAPCPWNPGPAAARACKELEEPISLQA